MTNDFIHKDETCALKALRSNKVFSMAMNVFNNAFATMTSFAEIPVNAFPVTEKTLPKLFHLYQTVREKLGVYQNPDLFLQIGYELRAEIIGNDDKCFIILYSESVSALSDEELSALLGHALSHVKYKHVGLMNLINNFEQITSGIGNIAKAAFHTLCLDWLKYAHFTADRGAAIASGTFGNVEAWFQKSLGFTNPVYLKAAPGKFWKSEGVEMEINGLAGRIFYQHYYQKLDVPFAILRLNELDTWCRSTSCKTLYPGCYYTLDMYELSQDADELLHLSAAYTETDTEEELKYLFAAAQKKHPLAMARIGQYLFYGQQGLQRSVQNITEGLLYLLQSARLGCSEAQFRLGACFFTGLDGFVDEDTSRGIMLLRLAAGKGYAPAVHYLEDKQIKIRVLSDEFWSMAVRQTRNRGNFIQFIMDYDNPVNGLHADNFSMYTELMDVIGYSARDKLYAVEYNTHSNGLDGIAVTASGIYFSCKDSLPDCVLWDEVLDGCIRMQEVGNYTYLKYGNQTIYQCFTDQRETTIFALLYDIFKMIKNK